MRKTTNKRGRPKGTANLPEKISAGVAAIAQVDPQSLILAAIDKDLPVESMERLLAMRREMKAEWARERYFEALAQFQKECPIIGKDKIAKIRSKKGEGSSFSYRYAPLETIIAEVQPFLEKWGFSWTCKPTQTDGNVKACIHAHHKDGHEEVTEFEVLLDPDSYMSAPQKAAAALTFATRYAFRGAFGIQTTGEDNDGDTGGADRAEPASYEIGKPKTDAELKALYDSVCKQIESLPPGQAEKLSDAADRNMDNKNGEALSALLESVKRQVASKARSA